MTCVIYTPTYLPDAPRLYLKYTPVQLTIPAKWSQVPRFVQMVVFVFVQQSALAFECKHGINFRRSLISQGMLPSSGVEACCTTPA